MRVLISGGSGFLGVNFTQYLLESASVSLLNLSLHEPLSHRYIEFWQKCDLLDAPAVKEKIQRFRPSHVVHLAAKTGASNDLKAFLAVNVQGTRNLLDALKSVSSVERVIFTSSSLVCQLGYVPKDEADYCPTTAYGQSKAEMERLVRSSGNLPFVWTIVRPVYIWGPWGELPLTNLLFRAISRGWYFHLHTPRYYKSLKSFGYVSNIAHQLYRILVAPVDKVHKKTFYLADPPITLWEFTEIVREEVGAGKIRCMPISAARVLARMGDILRACGWSSVPFSSVRLSNLLTEYVYPIEPIMEIAAPLPYDVRTGVWLTIEWMRRQSSKDETGRSGL